MKFIRFFLALAAILMVSLGCGLLGTDDQPDDASEPITTSAVEAAPAVSPYPVLDAGLSPEYPAGEISPQEAGLSGAVLYPELKDGDILEWHQVPGSINSGLVTQIVQTHDLKVYLTFVDGRTLMASEPAIDDILKVLDSCGEACSKLSVATE